MKTPLSSQATKLRERLRALRQSRRDRQATARLSPRRRQVLKRADRETVMQKTAGRCHICGGQVTTSDWQADHVLAHSGGGHHSIENYLPAHSLCNNYRWDYDAEEFQFVLKIGVWARREMERPTPLGDTMLSRFAGYERNRESRRRRPIP